MKKLCALLVVLLVFSMFGGTVYAAEREIQTLTLGKELSYEQPYGSKYFKITMPTDGTLTVDLEAELYVKLLLSDTSNKSIKASDANAPLGAVSMPSYDDNVIININSVEQRSVASVTYKSLPKGTYYLTTYTSYPGGKNISLMASNGAKATEAKPTGDPRVSIAVPLKKGQSFQLGTALSNTGNEQPTWKSSNEAIATVSSKGLVKAIKKGTTTITVTVAGKKHNVAVVVSD